MNNGSYCALCGVVFRVNSKMFALRITAEDMA